MTHLTTTLQQIAKAYQSPLGVAIRDGLLSRSALKVLAEQMYFQEKWPSHIACVYLGLDRAGLDDPSVIEYILSIIRAENLGVGSQGLTHHDLAERFARAVDVSPAQLRRAQPIAANQALMDWCDMSLQGRSWQESLAVHVACESQFDMMRVIRDGLSDHYHCPPKGFALWTVHAGRVERSHSRNGLRILEKHTRGSARRGVTYHYRFTCNLVRAFFDAILETDK